MKRNHCGGGGVYMKKKSLRGGSEIVGVPPSIWLSDFTSGFP